MLQTIEIYNVKSLKSVRIDFNKVTNLLGSNGTGKSNIINVLKYVYDALDTNETVNLQDSLNPYIQNSEIILKYDMKLIKTIARNALSDKVIDSNVHHYFRKLLEICKEYANNENILELKLNQSKTGEKKFNIESYEVRKIIKNLFPLYIIKTREINLIDWETIWDVVADIGRFPQKKDKDIKEAIEKSFPQINKKTNKTYLDVIRETIAGNGIEIKTSNINSGLYQFLIGGNSFTYDKKDLEHYSDGLNSFNYIKIFLKLINLIPGFKIKYPIILIDEPEIGLHPKYIDQLAELFIESNSKIRIILATHSSRLLKTLMSENKDVNLYHLKLVDNYTICNKMNYLLNLKGKNLITEEEASYFFSEAIAFVEGISELELYHHKRLNELFPTLKRISFYSFDSNNQKLKVIHPKEKDLSIPYLTIVDSDKIFTYDYSTSKINFLTKSSIYNPFADTNMQKKEIFHYGQKRTDTLHVRNQILRVTKNVNFYFDDYWGILKGKNIYHEELLNLINRYCLEYSVFPVKTTLEGCLINRQTIKIYISWLESENPKKLLVIRALFSTYKNRNINITIARLIQKGKFDNILTRKQMNEHYKKKNLSNSIINQLFADIDSLSTDKTQWITSFLDYWFEEHEDLTITQRRDKFNNDFPELSSILNNLLNLIK
ncbi:retron Eco8 family effector endonuclease [Planococcus sp. SE5232]|uniref:retron Eco8 family effector endonuclease n=1 Tax=unclassified Planococcus (in: firmicutes) TaxID=2662419 RepID=UPI003D6C0847